MKTSDSNVSATAKTSDNDVSATAKTSDNDVSATAKTSDASFTETPTAVAVEPATAGTVPGTVQIGQYRYAGPMSGVTLADGQEVMLCPGGEVALPATHDYTRTLLALGHLTPVAQPASTPTEERNHAS